MKPSEEARINTSSGYIVTGVGTSAWSATYGDSVLFVALEAGVTYKISSAIYAVSTSSTPDLKWRFIYSGTVNAISIASNLDDDAITPTVASIGGKTLNTPLPGVNISSVAANVYRIIQTLGIIIPSSSGLLKFEWGQTTLSTTSMRITAGSYILVEQV